MIANCASNRSDRVAGTMVELPDQPECCFDVFAEKVHLIPVTVFCLVVPVNVLNYFTVFDRLQRC